jgi:predicted ATPase
MLELRAATSLARLWKKLDQLDEAKSILSSVYSSFTEGFGSPDLIEAKTVLEQLIEQKGPGSLYFNSICP